MRSSRIFFCAAAALFGHLLQPCSTVHAASGPRLSLQELVQRSDATVLGRPVAQRSFWDQGRIVTRVELEVDEVWQGGVARGATLGIYTLGGTVGDIGQRVDGAATLPSYGRVVLHLRRAARGYVPTAMAQGVWDVDGLYSQRALVRPQAEHLLGYVHPVGAGNAVTPTDLTALRTAVKEAALARP